MVHKNIKYDKGKILIQEYNGCKTKDKLYGTQNDQSIDSNALRMTRVLTVMYSE